MRNWIILIVFCFITAGCDRDKTIDEIKIIQSLGYDIEGDKIIGSASYPVYVKSTQNPPEFKLLTAKSDTSHGIFTSFTYQSPYPIEIGQTRSILLGEEFAKRGISEVIGTLVRDPIMGSNAKIVISKQSARTILSEMMKYPPFYMSNIIEQNMVTGNMPQSNVHSVLFQYYGDGQDISLPFIRLNESGSLEMDGLGVFKKDKLKLHLNNTETFLFKLITNKKIHGYMEFVTEEKEKIFLKVMYGQNQLSVVNSGDKPRVKLNLTLNILLKDFPSELDLSNKKDALLITNKTEEHLSKKVKELIETFRDNQLDPIGIGDAFRGKERDWNQKNFDEKIYPNLSFEVYVKCNLLQSGVGD
ncbi:germination protein, Ger(x)C family [Peribacillus simplex]|uniref:Germination protein, Ger(X)C family n=1 Tax=Peribacillus simplex TaxID=1478 RepID=A0A9X8RDV9_9BACI|nr:Ger(x)C family spore germination protein [Peribacillus simplex]SIS03823.1 germination protein, Ger(x)C family [Peribacillus simplex]